MSPIGQSAVLLIREVLEWSHCWKGHTKGLHCEVTVPLLLFRLGYFHGVCAETPGQQNLACFVLSVCFISNSFGFCILRISFVLHYHCEKALFSCSDVEKWILIPPEFYTSQTSFKCQGQGHQTISSDFET